MDSFIKVSNPLRGYTDDIQIQEISECPMCKHAIKPVIINSAIFEASHNEFKLSITNLCKACNNTFIAQYKLDKPDNSGRFYSSNFEYSAPNKFIKKNFDDLINKVSPNFVNIYNQALAAESQELDEIAGIGYRKALEFLIKDFLISKYPDEKEDIEKTLLGSCINKYIENPQLKTAASRAVWLGNDQTHYIQKFTDKDINDLKRLISLTVHWISMILETEEAATIEPIK